MSDCLGGGVGTSTVAAVGDGVCNNVTAGEVVDGWATTLRAHDPDGVAALFGCVGQDGVVVGAASILSSMLATQ